MSSIFPIIPKRLLSRVTGLLMRVPLPKSLAPPVLRGFAAFFGIRVIEAEKPLAEYRSCDDFFTRRLKPELRPVHPSSPLVHPADACLTVHGSIVNGMLVQAKGWTYSLGEFLGDDTVARRYEGGHYLTYYLCPADYHRVHAPCSGDLLSARHIPGLLWPVNEWSVNKIRRLFNLNERVVLNFQSPSGRWSLVMVGATNVGHITIAQDPSIVTNSWRWGAPTDRQYIPPIGVGKGQEVGTFHLGSTVICVFAPGLMKSAAKVAVGPVKMGEPLFQAE